MRQDPHQKLALYKSFPYLLTYFYPPLRRRFSDDLFRRFACRIQRWAEVLGHSLYEACAKATAITDIRAVSVSFSCACPEDRSRMRTAYVYTGWPPRIKPLPNDQWNRIE